MKRAVKLCGFGISGFLVLVTLLPSAAETAQRKAPILADVLAASSPEIGEAFTPENVTLVGRVVLGMELLSALPRGTGGTGFYERAEQRVPIKSIRVAGDVPAVERSELEILRTDTPAFKQLIEARRNRREDWFQFQAGRIEISNVPIPIRSKRADAPQKPR